jgi:hypothetical protein
VIIVLNWSCKNGKGEKDERGYGIDPSGFLQRPASLLEAKGKMLL